MNDRVLELMVLKLCRLVSVYGHGIMADLKRNHPEMDLTDVIKGLNDLKMRIKDLEESK